MSEKKQRFLEALLFASEGALARQKIKRFMSLNDQQLDELVSGLQKKYVQTNSSFKISSTSQQVILNVEDEFVPEIKNFLEAEFSSTLLKTLAIVAYRSPITQSDIIKARGNKSYSHVNELIALGLVQAEEYGKTKLLRLTPKFFKYFNVTEKQLKQAFTKTPGETQQKLVEPVAEPEQKQKSPKKPKAVKQPKQEEKTAEPKKSEPEPIKTVQEGDRNTANDFFSS
ncbi:hypothetical protein COT72_04160 [archaeon CG10_big_fil_rev_8_21_14_0_10_43_11]|nr:MAG: hypothetical protein COT72_04160 [archaeon CG10_big_fil_rev_8_21_14_0_10_43_11]